MGAPRLQFQYLRVNPAACETCPHSTGFEPEVGKCTVLIQIVKVGPSIIPMVSQRMAINRLAQIILQRDCVRFFLPNAPSIFIR